MKKKLIVPVSVMVDLQSRYLHHPGSHRPVLELTVPSDEGIILVINKLILDLQSRYFLGSSLPRPRSCDEQDRCCCFYVVQSLSCHVSMNQSQRALTAWPKNRQNKSENKHIGFIFDRDNKKTKAKGWVISNEFLRRWWFSTIFAKLPDIICDILCTKLADEPEWGEAHVVCVIAAQRVTLPHRCPDTLVIALCPMTFLPLLVFARLNPASSTYINSCWISSASICKTLWNTVKDNRMLFNIYCTEFFCARTLWAVHNTTP